MDNLTLPIIRNKLEEFQVLEMRNSRDYDLLTQISDYLNKLPKDLGQVGFSSIQIKMLTDSFNDIKAQNVQISELLAHTINWLERNQPQPLAENKSSRGRKGNTQTGNIQYGKGIQTFANAEGDVIINIIQDNIITSQQTKTWYVFQEDVKGLESALNEALAQKTITKLDAETISLIAEQLSKALAQQEKDNGQVKDYGELLQKAAETIARLSGPIMIAVTTILEHLKPVIGN
jgi:hypothetical protein